MRLNKEQEEKGIKLKLGKNQTLRFFIKNFVQFLKHLSCAVQNLLTKRVFCVNLVLSKKVR